MHFLVLAYISTVQGEGKVQVRYARVLGKLACSELPLRGQPGKSRSIEK